MRWERTEPLSPTSFSHSSLTGRAYSRFRFLIEYVSEMLSHGPDNRRNRVFGTRRTADGSVSMLIEVVVRKLFKFLVLCPLPVEPSRLFNSFLLWECRLSLSPVSIFPKISCCFVNIPFSLSLSSKVQFTPASDQITHDRRSLAASRIILSSLFLSLSPVVAATPNKLSKLGILPLCLFSL